MAALAHERLPSTQQVTGSSSAAMGEKNGRTLEPDKLKFAEPQSATPQDNSRIAAKKIFEEAEQLRKQGAEESLRSAIKKFEAALPLWQAAGDRAGEALTLHSIGKVHYSLYEYERALDFFNRALRVRQTVGDRRGEADTVNYIGMVYLSWGENQEALSHFNQALRLARAIGYHQKEGHALHNIGLAYDALGEKQKALNYLNQALPFIQAEKNRVNEVRWLNNIGLVYKDLGENKRALDSFNKALLIAQATGDRAGEALTLHHIGSVYDSSGEKRTALRYEEEALRLRQAEGNRYREAYVLIKIGSIHNSLGENQKALNSYNQALSLIQAVGDRAGEVLTRAGLARVERDRGNLSEACTQIAAALKIVESLRSKITIQELRATYLASVQKDYEFYIDLLMRLHRERPSEGFDAAALQASERARARGLLELLNEARASIRQGVDSALLERERSLQRQLNAKEGQRMHLSGDKHSQEQAKVLAKEIEELTTEYQQVEGDIRRSSPSYAALTQPQPLSLKEIQQALDRDTVLLEYALGEERSYVWAVTPTAVNSYELAKRAEIEAAAGRVYELLTARGQRRVGETAEQQQARITQAEAQFPEAASRLSRMLLSQVAAQLGTKRLLIVSDGALQYVPFAALPVPAAQVSGARDQVPGDVNATRHPAPDTRPLIVEHEIVSLPSASVLAVLRRETAGRKSAAKAVAVLADPVFDKDDERVGAGIRDQARKGADTRAHQSAEKVAAPVSLRATDAEQVLRDAGLIGANGTILRLSFSRREAERILAAAPAREGRVALGFEASRQTAMSAELSQYRIVHFATHGLIHSEHPELSGLVFSLIDKDGAPQDGFLRLHEIYNLKLPADLVVLSACQTARGKEIKGEGLVGLTRGFMYAGATRLVASLWNVDDAATAELMGHFYEGMLRKKLQPAAALREAQVQMWKHRRRQWQAPYYWAGFVLQGEWK